MENDFLTDFVQQISKEEEARNAEKKRKEFFREIGRKGGLRKKTSTHLLRKFTVRFTEREFEEIQKLSKKHSLKISEYIRLVLTEKELKINEFRTDETLLSYANNFTHIKNLLRHREWNVFENKKIILQEIEKVTELMRRYLIEKLNENE